MHSRYAQCVHFDKQAGSTNEVRGLRIQLRDWRAETVAARLPRVILNKTMAISCADADTAELSELTYLLESGSDRIGALAFQRSSLKR